MSDVIERYCAAMERTQPSTVDELLAFFADDARFKDPFSDVRGKDKIRRAFVKAHADADDVRIHITDKAKGGDAHYLRWTLTCMPKGFMRRQGELVVHGLSEIHVDDEGRVTAHIDYWDPALDLYRRVPVLGSVLGALRRQIGVR